MKKTHFFILCGLLFASQFVSAQKNDEPTSIYQVEKSQYGNLFKPNNPETDKIEIFDITGSNGISFAVSNISDGMPGSYKHKLKITMGLISSNNKAGNIQLIFYPSSEKMPYAVETATDGTLNVYYPAELFDPIKQKLDQNLSLKKKIQLKTTQKTNGFREGTLVF